MCYKIIDRFLVNGSKRATKRCNMNKIRYKLRGNGWFLDKDCFNAVKKYRYKWGIVSEREHKHYTLLDISKFIDWEESILSQGNQRCVVDTSGLDTDKLSLLDGYIETIEDREGNLIHVLHRAQEIFGYLPASLQLYIARALHLPGAKVNGVVSFYSFFTQEPRGKHTISICMGTACFVRGAKEVLDKTKELLGIENNQMTEDGLFTLRDIRCVGACGLAPVVMVNDKVYGHMTPEKMEELIESLKEEEKRAS